jgi:maleate isomerase
MSDRKRIGLLIPASDTVMEADLWRRLPLQFTLHPARMYMESTTVEGERKMLNEELEPAARRVASVRPELVIFGCTSAAAIDGLERDADISRRVSRLAGCPCITVVQAAIREIGLLKPQRLLLVTPYNEDINRRMANTFRNAGLPVDGATGLGLEDDLAIGAVSPDEIRRFVSESVNKQANRPDCVFISCTTFRSFEAAAEIEADLGMPVMTSNKGAWMEIQRHFNLVEEFIKS